MKLCAKTGIARLWRMVVLLAALSMVTTTVGALAFSFGERYGGGVVFYVDDTGKHGLVAADADLPQTMIWSDAKSACATFGSGGYSDWFLPNKEQLLLLYHQRDVVGGFSCSNYWSASESDIGAWGQYFGSGSQLRYFTIYPNRVRPVRTF
jgi:hypothetical protein